MPDRSGQTGSPGTWLATWLTAATSDMSKRVRPLIFIVQPRAQADVPCHLARSSIFLSTFLKVGPWGTVNQVTRKFPLLRPLMWLMVPPSIVMTMPALLRMNHQEVQARIARRDRLDHPDYLQHLMPSSGSADEEMPSEEWLFAQADQMMAAGMDPLTNILTAAVCFLCTSPQSLERLLREVRDSFKSRLEIKAEALQSFRYLQAVIDETLRLHTNAAFGLPRLSPGAMVDGHYVPKNVSTASFSFFPLFFFLFLSPKSSLPNHDSHHCPSSDTDAAGCRTNCSLRYHA